MKILFDAGFSEVELDELLSLCPSILQANAALQFAGTAGCPFWGIIPFILRSCYGPDASWMVNDYGYAKCFRSPHHEFLAFVYEDDGKPSLTFILPLTSEESVLAYALARDADILSPILDLQRQFAERTSAIATVCVPDSLSRRLEVRFLTRDYYYVTKHLAAMAKEFVLRSELIKVSDSALDERLQRGYRALRTIRSYTKNQDCTVHEILEDDSSVFAEISAMTREWRRPRLERGELMVMVDEYEHAFHPATLKALRQGGVLWSGHYMRNENGEIIAASLGVATSTTDWCCIFRVDKAGNHHASEVPWLLDAMFFHEHGFQRAFDGGGSETVGYTGLSELKERYATWTQGGAHVLYALTVPEHASRFDTNQAMKDKHDRELRLRGFTPSEE